MAGIRGPYKKRAPVTPKQEYPATVLPRDIGGLMTGAHTQPAEKPQPPGSISFIGAGRKPDPAPLNKIQVRMDEIADKRERRPVTLIGDAPVSGTELVEHRSATFVDLPNRETPILAPRKIERVEPASGTSVPVGGLIARLRAEDRSLNRSQQHHRSAAIAEALQRLTEFSAVLPPAILAAEGDLRADLEAILAAL